MAVCGLATKLALALILAILITYFFAFKPTHNVVNDVSAFLVGCKLDIRCYPSRNSGRPRRGRASCDIPTCGKITNCIHMVKFFLAAGYFVLLATDVNLNPGPIASGVMV